MVMVQVIADPRLHGQPKQASKGGHVVSTRLNCDKRSKLDALRATSQLAGGQYV